MSSWHSYSKIFAVGHRAVADILNGPVLVEEKCDGSQFSFGNVDGELRVRSKGAVMVTDAPERMFTLGVDTVKALAAELHPGWTYRGEFLCKPKHNALAYDRVPKGHIIIFDVNTDHETYLDYEQKAAEAERLGLECVPLIYCGMVGGIDLFRSFLERTSILGGQKIEGVVIKPERYDVFGEDKHVLMAKFVSEAYKEVHAREWKESNPSNGDILDLLGSEYRTPARWQKAVQHLAEAGTLDGSPRDIGPLMKAVPVDIEEECAAEIKEKLWRWAWPHIRRKAVAGAAEWYKEELLKKQFGEGGS